MNELSHRKEHRIVRKMIEHDWRNRGTPPPTPEDYRTIRRTVAADRRREQRDNRIAAGTDRKTIKARRAQVLRLIDRLQSE